MRDLIIITLIIALVGCQPSGDNKKSESTIEDTPVENPAADGFDLQNSHPEAIKIADDVMIAMGGRQKWDDTRYISWNFFDRRKLYWDKLTGDVRVKYLTDDLDVLVNINSGAGRVMRNGAETTNQDSLNYYLKRAKSAWINDAYWLVMPFKLKDSGVTLRYIDVDTTMDGRQAYLLDMNFENVGDTPQNYYQVWVDTESKLVTQWAYYREATQAEPNFVMPWREYKDYNGLKLSGNRGERELTEIKVHESIPQDFFKDFTVINI